MPAITTSERFPRANDAWEDRAEPDKMCVAWKLAYKQAHAKARVKAQAHGGTTNFGAENSATPPEAQLPLDAQHEGAGENINSLEGYFTNLAAAATNEKEILNQLVLNNTTLTTTNESLVALVKNQANDLKNLDRELTRLKKPQAQASPGTPPPFALTAKRRGITKLKIVMSSQRTKKSAPQDGTAPCDGGGPYAITVAI